MNNMVQIPQNHKERVKFILKTYTDRNIPFSNAFVKDVIQNAVGAREHKDNWDGWRFTLEIITNEHGQFLLVEDFGTLGLTGPNLSAEQLINDYIVKEIEVPSTYRLARFSSMHNSGDNQTGGGLFGVGKVMYAAASEDYTYYYDSLRCDGGYIANCYENGNINSISFENDSAHDYIKQTTGLDPRTEVGTRVIIKNPKPELIVAINSGEIEKDIQEIWWLVLTKLPESAAIMVNGKNIGIPEIVTPEYKAIHSYKLPSPYKVAEGRRVKHYGLKISDELDPRWQGIAYYRRYMKIGQIDMKNAPDKVKSKYWGFIEVDNEWENALAEIEDNIHYDVGNKMYGCYQSIKNYANEVFDEQMKAWRFVEDKEHQDRRLREELQQVAKKLQNLFHQKGFDDLGSGQRKPDFSVRWQHIAYPHSDNATIRNNEKMSFSFRTKSDYRTEKKFEYSLKVISDSGFEYCIDSGEFSLSPDGVFVKDYDFLVTDKVAEKHQKNQFLLTVKPKESNNTKRKAIDFWYEIDTPKASYRNITLFLNSCEFPREGSRRVNSNETLKNVYYRIENKNHLCMTVSLRASTHNFNDSGKQKIEDLFTQDIILLPFEEKLINIGDIEFAKGMYEKFLLEGIVELRARLIATEDSGEYEKGEKITDYKLQIFFNRDEKKGPNNSFNIELVKDPTDDRRSWTKGTGHDRTIVINLSHPAFIRCDGTDFRMPYLEEQMLKQFVCLYLDESNYAPFNKPGSPFDSLNSLEAIERVNRKVEEILHASLI